MIVVVKIPDVGEGQNPQDYAQVEHRQKGIATIRSVNSEHTIGVWSPRVIPRVGLGLSVAAPFHLKWCLIVIEFE
jgi:hypothetical protein